MMPKTKSFYYGMALLAALIFGFCQLHAQLPVKMLGYSADTIYPKLINANDHQRMKAWNQLAFYHSMSTPDSALFYAEQALQLAEKFKDEDEKRFALRNAGNAYALAGNYRQAMINLHKALEIAENRSDQRKQLELYADLGKLNYDIDDYIKALEFVDKIINILLDASKQGNAIVTPIEEAIAYFYSGGAAREAKQYERAVSYFKKYIELSEQYIFPDEMNRHAIKSLAETYEYAAEFDSALKYTYIAQSYMPKNKNRDYAEHTGYEGSLGKLFYQKGFYNKALKLLILSYNQISSTGQYYYAARGSNNRNCATTA
jgi:tetratricopeptide (TPR) repeat protein